MITPRHIGIPPANRAPDWFVPVLHPNWLLGQLLQRTANTFVECSWSNQHQALSNTLKFDSLNFVERNLIRSAVIELRSTGRLVRGDLLRVLQGIIRPVSLSCHRNTSFRDKLST